MKGKFNRNRAERNESVKEESPISGVESQKFTAQNFTGSATSDSNSNGAVKEESNVDSPRCFNESFPNSGSVINCLQYSRGSPERAFQTQFMRMEEQSLFAVNNEFCNFFSVDQSPTL
ncbi:hypothetical protein L6164_029117 [Bauhinia variegata]|nr:hypothetical protein L6164_029117 [Bauhinia variegata]